MPWAPWDLFSAHGPDHLLAGGLIAVALVLWKAGTWVARPSPGGSHAAWVALG